MGLFDVSKVDVSGRTAGERQREAIQVFASCADELLRQRSKEQVSLADAKQFVGRLGKWLSLKQPDLWDEAAVPGRELLKRLRSLYDGPLRDGFVLPSIA